MEVLLGILIILALFAFGPVVAMFDLLSRELAREGPGDIDLRRLAAGMLVLLIPLAWIVYFLVWRRRLPFDEE
jgi:hypothetical protein